MRRRAIAVHVTANLIDIDGDETTILDTRQGTQGGSNVEHVRRRALDMIDAYVYGLASRIPTIGDDLERAGPHEAGIVCLWRSQAVTALEALDAWLDGHEPEDDPRAHKAAIEAAAELGRAIESAADDVILPPKPRRKGARS